MRRATLKIEEKDPNLSKLTPYLQLRALQKLAMPNLVANVHENTSITYTTNH